jgi:ketosteroid isomerase-like protein
MGGRPPSNRAFRQTAVAAWRFDDAGAITEERRYYDPADILRQLAR